MQGLARTPFKLDRNELLAAAAASLIIRQVGELCSSSTIGEICENPQYGYTERAVHEPVGPRFVRITDIKAGAVNWEEVPFCHCNAVTNYQLREGDILVGRTGSVGKSFVVDQVPEHAVFASYLIRLRPKVGVNSRYVYWCLQSASFWDQILEMSRGSAIKNINGKMLTRLVFPLPDRLLQDAVATFLDGFCRYLLGRDTVAPELPEVLSKQRRMIAKIEQLAAKIDEAQGLRHIAIAQAEALFEQARERVFKRATIHGVRPLSEIANLERGKFSHRPRNDPRFFGGEHPWIQIAEIEHSSKYIRDWSETLNDDGLAISKKFAKGTVLVSIAATIGAVGILDFACCVPDSIVGVMPTEGMDSEFLYHYLGYVRTHLETVAPQSAQKNINLQILSPLPVPNVPFPDQRRMVAELDALKSKVDSIKALQTETAAELDALLPSILDKAFKGEL